MATQAQSLPAATDKQVARVQAKTANINRMGYYVDGWADLAENMGEKVEAVQDGVHQQLVDREMPDIKIHHVTANAGIFSSSSTRSYVTTTTFPGATTTVYVGKHGKDLYVSWRTFIKRIPNWRLLTAIALLALMMGISSGGCALLSGIQINRAANEFRGNVSRDPIGEFFGGYSGGQPETDYAPFYIIRPLQLMGLSFAALFVNTMGWFFAADRKSTRLNSSHQLISYAVFCLKKKK